MLTLALLFIGVILGSALCSMVEAAILSLPYIRAKMLFEEKRHNAATLLYIKEHINIAIAAIVILNNAINIIGSIFVGQEVVATFGNKWLGLASAVITFTIIVISEVLPKTIGERYKVGLSLFFAQTVLVLVWILRPIVELILRLAGPFTGRYRLPNVTEEEIKMMLKLGRDAGTVQTNEEDLCGRVFKLNDLKAFQMMRPMEQIYALSADKSLSELKEEIINCPFSRITIYDKDPRDIIGTVQQRILLREIARDNDLAKIRDFMVRPIFVPHLTTADELLKKFQSTHQHLFIVQDDRGQDVGIITMEDVLEELFGEIYDEKDVKPKTGPASPIE